MSVEPWELVESEQLEQYRITRVRRDRRRSPRTGAEHDFVVLQMAEWVNVIAVTRARRLVVIEQYRHGTQDVSVEIPGGVVDAEDGQDWVAAARRELREETGYDAEHFELIGCVAANPAIQDNRCRTVLALGAHRVGELDLDEGEDIAVDEIDLGDVAGLIESGRINHALVIAGYWWFEHWRRQHAATLARYTD